MYAPPAERQGRPLTAQGALPSVLPSAAELACEGEHRGLLASPAFWLGGAASVLVWTGLVLAILRLV